MAIAKPINADSQSKSSLRTYRECTNKYPSTYTMGGVICYRLTGWQVLRFFFTIFWDFAFFLPRYRDTSSFPIFRNWTICSVLRQSCILPLIFWNSSHCFPIFRSFSFFFWYSQNRRDIMRLIRDLGVIYEEFRGQSTLNNTTILNYIARVKESTSCDKNFPSSFNFGDFRFFILGLRDFPILLPEFQDLTPLMYHMLIVS